MPVCIKNFSLFLFFVFFIESIEAVDSRALWLPKKYNDARPLLMNVAQQAEKDERCIVVIAGEMIVSKSTERDYYFVVTCRDSLKRSYNLSYVVQKKGGVSELLEEQRSSKSAVKEGGVALGKKGLTKESALGQCALLLKEETVLSGVAEVIEEQIFEQERDSQWVYSFGYPFNTKNRLDEIVRFDANCHVDADGVAELDLGPLHREQALEDCYEGLEDESILIGWIEILYPEVSGLPYKEEWAYRFNMPFNSKNREGELVRYNADCRISEDRDVEVETRIDIDSVKSICLRAVKKEAKKMMKVTILEDSAEPVVELEYEFRSSIPFDASDPVGRKLHYLGECIVSDEGRSSVKIVPRSLLPVKR